MPWAKISFRQNRNWICDTEIFWGLQGKIQYQIQFDDKKQSFADGDEDDLYKGPMSVYTDCQQLGDNHDGDDGVEGDEDDDDE